MLIDLTEGFVTALPQERPRALVFRIADHPDFEGFVTIGSVTECHTLALISDDSFSEFFVYEFQVRREHLKESMPTSFWVYSAYTDGNQIDRCSAVMMLRREGANGWWLEIRHPRTNSTYLTTDELAFRLPLEDFEPDLVWTDEPVEREPDWAKLTEEDAG